MSPECITAIATVVYAILTILILLANRKSAKAANAQIIEMQRQQRITTGLQLYNKRKKVLEEIQKGSLSGQENDLIILFGTEYFIRADALFHELKQIESFEDGEGKETALRKNRIAIGQLCTDMLEYIMKSLDIDEGKSK